MAIKNSSTLKTISDEFLELASNIVRDKEAQEGSLRTAISRAYYSVFLTVRDQLFGEDNIMLTNPKRKQLRKKFSIHYQGQRAGGSHDEILFAITDLPPKGFIKPLTLYQQIEQLKEARTHADYHFTLENLKDIPYDSWAEYADKMVALASQLLPVARGLPPYK